MNLCIPKKMYCNLCQRENKLSLTSFCLYPTLLRDCVILERLPNLLQKFTWLDLSRDSFSLHGIATD